MINAMFSVEPAVKYFIQNSLRKTKHLILSCLAEQYLINAKYMQGKLDNLRPDKKRFLCMLNLSLSLWKKDFPASVAISGTIISFAL